MRGLVSASVLLASALVASSFASIGGHSPLASTTPSLNDDASTSARAVDSAGRRRTSASNPLVIKGYNFFDSVTGDHVVIRGIDYYPRPNAGPYNWNNIDFYTEKFRHIWERDINYFVELGINAIRLYAVDPAEDHDSFMCALRSAGIYVVVGLASSCPGCEVTGQQSPDCYPPSLKTRGQEIVSQFTKYDNTLGFSAGNEINHRGPLDIPQWNAPCQKKFLRDMRAYIDSCPHMRKVPVGVVMADTDREVIVKYYNCRSNVNDEYEHAEWFGLNTYVSCDGSIKSLSEARGFGTLMDNFRSYQYSIPVLLTEFGCLSLTFPDMDGYEHQRNFIQAYWLATSPKAQELFAGGFVFEYSIEAQLAKAESPYPFHKFGHQNYGVGYFSPEDCDDLNNTCSYNPMPSFYNLKKAYAGELANGTDDDGSSSDTIRMDEFEPVEGRTGRTECPANFLPLNNFTWKADDREDMDCPAPSSAFTCPIAGQAIGTAQVESTMMFYLVAVAFVIVAFILFVPVIIWMSRRHGKGDATGREGREEVSDLEVVEATHEKSAMLGKEGLDGKDSTDSSSCEGEDDEAASLVASGKDRAGGYESLP